MDIGNATLLVLPGSVGGLSGDSLLLPGGSRADVFLDEDGDTLVQVGADAVTSAQLVAAVLRAPGLSVHARQLDVAVVGEAGHDRLVFSADRQHLFLHTRRWTGQQGPEVVVVSAFPRTDRDGAPTDDVIVAAARLLRSTLVPAGAVATTFVETQIDRSGSRPTSLADAGLRATSLADADMVLPAWGAMDPRSADGIDAVVDELREARDAGTRVLLPSVDGAPRTSGRPPQPSADLTAAREVRLVDAPAGWLWGGPLD